MRVIELNIIKAILKGLGLLIPWAVILILLNSSDKLPVVPLYAVIILLTAVTLPSWILFFNHLNASLGIKVKIDPSLGRIHFESNKLERSIPLKDIKMVTRFGHTGTHEFYIRRNSFIIELHYYLIEIMDGKEFIITSLMLKEYDLNLKSEYKLEHESIFPWIRIDKKNLLFVD